MKFRPKSQHELAKLEEEELLTYLVSARDAGDSTAMSDAVYVLVHGRMPMVVAMVSRKTPWHVREELVADIFTDICLSASKGFDGEHIGQFVNFIKQVTARRIADFIDKQKRRIPTDPLDHGDEERWRPEPVSHDADPEATLWIEEIVETVIADRSESHQKVIRMRLDGIPTKEVAEDIGNLSVANIDKVFSRFRKELSQKLEL